jgi:hypothetical protein
MQKKTFRVETLSAANQGCHMVYFQTKNPNLGKFWRALKSNILVYVMSICNIYLRLFCIIYGRLVI